MKLTKQQLKQIIKEELSSLQQEALKLSFPKGQVGQANSTTRKNYCGEKFSDRVEECVALEAEDKEDLDTRMNTPLGGQGALWAGGGVGDFPPKPRDHTHTSLTKQQLEQIIKEELGKMLNEKPEGRPIVWGGGTSDAEANVAAINTMQKNWEDVKDDLRQRGITEKDVLLGYKTVWKTLPPKVTQDTVNSLKATYQFPVENNPEGRSLHRGQKMAIEDLDAWLATSKENPPWAGSIGA